MSPIEMRWQRKWGISLLCEAMAQSQARTNILHGKSLMSDKGAIFQKCVVVVLFVDVIEALYNSL